MDIPTGVIGPVIVKLTSKTIAEYVWNGVTTEGESPVGEIVFTFRLAPE